MVSCRWERRVFHGWWTSIHQWRNWECGKTYRDEYFSLKRHWNIGFRKCLSIPMLLYTTPTNWSIDMQIWSSIPFWCILTWLLTWVQTMTNWQWANWQTMNAAHHVRQWQSSLLRHLWGVANMKGCIEYSYFVIKHILWVKTVGIQLTQPPLQIDRLTWRPCCARVMILNTDNCWPQLCRGRYS